MNQAACANDQVRSVNEGGIKRVILNDGEKKRALGAHTVAHAARSNASHEPRATIRIPMRRAMRSQRDGDVFADR